MAFDGDKKADRSLLYGPETRLKDFLVPLVPDFIETYHLTLVSLLWILLLLVFGFLARYDAFWLWGSSAVIALQYITDLLDGEIGRRRRTGLVKWGFYMDHFLDYLFICALLIGYSFLVSEASKVIIFFLIALFGGFMVNSFLSFAATNRFEITFSRIGPTEARIFFILVNTVLIFLPEMRYFEAALPAVFGLSAFGLFLTVYRTQRNLWRVDMTERERKAGSSVRRRREREARLRTLRLVRNFTFGTLLLLGAFVVAYLRLFPPFYRGISLMLAAWSLALYVFTIATRRRTPGGRVRKILTYAVFLFFLAAVSYGGFVLLPRPDGRTDREMRESVRMASDFARLNALREEGLLRAELLQRSGTDGEESGRRMLALLEDVQALSSRYAYFFRIDFNADPEEHSRVYALHFGARILQERFYLMMKSAQVPSEMWEESVRGVRLRRRFREELTDAERLLKTAAGLQYFRLIRSRLSGKELAGFDLEAEGAVLLERLQSGR